MNRVLGYFLDKINHRVEKTIFSREIALSGSSPNWQYGCPDYIRGLRSIPFWDMSLIPGVESLQQAFRDIKQEFSDARNKVLVDPIGRSSPAETSMLFQPYRSPRSTTTGTSNPSVFSVDELGALATDSGAWSVCYLHLHGMDFSANRDAFPITASLIA